MVPTVLVCEALVGKDVTDHLLAGHGVDELVPVEDDHEGASFDRVDLGPYLDGTVEQVVPDMLTMTDGRALLHRARLNGVHGDSGAGKSWLMMFLLRSSSTPETR